jgi:hypothetical protein
MKGWVALPGLLALGSAQMGGCEWSVADVVVLDETDAFSATLSVPRYTGTVDRAWTCETSQAQLRISPITAGRVKIEIYDALDAPVYANTHGGLGGLDVRTAPGHAGAWRVVLEFTDTTIEGALTLEADRAKEPDYLWLGDLSGSSDRGVFHAAWETCRLQVSLDPVLSGRVVVRLWHGGTAPGADAPFFERTVGLEGLNVLTPAGKAGTWTIQLDFSEAVLDGSIWILPYP